MAASSFDVVVLSSMEWGAAWQRLHTFAAQWAKAGHRVFFVESSGSREPGLRDLGRIALRLKQALTPHPPSRHAHPDGLEIISSPMLPPTRNVFRAVNARALAPRLVAKLKAAGLRPGAVVFVYLPTATTFQILDRLDSPSVVYDCADNVRGLARPPAGFDANEAELLKRSLLVVTSARTLYEDKKSLHPNVLELHHGTGAAFFLPPRAPGPHRRFAYFGTLWRAIDYAPIRALAEAGFDVALIGPQKDAPPPLPASVRRIGPLSHEDLPAALSAFDGLLLPYVNDEYNRGVIPAKTYECLATGRPVLASPLPALTALPELSVLRFARTPDEWVAAARALDETETPAVREARLAVARAHSEEKAFATLAKAVTDARVHS